MKDLYDKEALRGVPPIENIRFVIKDVMQYRTLGDYNDNGIIELYRGMNKLQRILVGLHELFEFYTMKISGVSALDISCNDVLFDNNGYGKIPKYLQAHLFANRIEQKVVEISQIKYDKELLRYGNVREIKYDKKRKIYLAQRADKVF